MIVNGQTVTLPGAVVCTVSQAVGVQLVEVVVSEAIPLLENVD